MTITRLLASVAVLAGAFVGALVETSAAQESPRLKVLATTTDLRELAREVGGAHVQVTCLTKGPEDPHFIEARPSFVRAAAEADALLVIGMELEIGYESLLLGDSRNGKIQKGRPGYVDCSRAIDPLEVPTGPIDRSMGDVHAAGNPHYLLDPVRAKKVAGTIAEAFATLDPDRAQAYRDRLAAFARSVDVAMWGEPLLADQPAERLERRLREGTLLEFLDQRGLREKCGGFAAVMAPLAGRKVVTYHANFSYLLDRFHLVDVAKLEPRPGIPPSPRHLADVIRRMRSEGVRAVLHTVYQPAKTAESVAGQAGATAVRLAHMPDALPGTSTYLDMLRHDVNALAAALGTPAPDSR